MPELAPRTRDALLLLVATLLLFGSRTASLPLFDLDEGAFSEATRELLHSGDWLMTTLNGQPRYDKPILIYWLQALSVRALGETELAFRLPSIICASAWVLLVHGFVYERGGRIAALFAAASLGLSVMVGVIAHAATADALLNLCIAAALLDIWRWLESPRRCVLLRIYFWLALGTLTKGPIAVAIPLAVVALQTIWTGRWRDSLRAALYIPGWILFLAVVLPWLVALSLRDGGDFLRHFLFDHNLLRYTKTLQRHGGQLWYYLLWLPLILLPFSSLLAGSLGQAWRQRREPFQAFLLSWFAVVFLLFSFSSTQLPHYLLYGCTPLFVLFGLRSESPGLNRALLLPGLGLLAILAALPWLLPGVVKQTQRAYEAGVLQLAISSINNGYIAVTIGALIVALVIARISRPMWQRLLGIGLIQAVVVWGVLVPLLAAAQQEPVRRAALIARGSGQNAVSYRTDMPSFSVYRGAITENRVPRPGELVLVRRDRIDELRAKLPGLQLETVYAEGGIVLLRYPQSR